MRTAKRFPDMWAERACAACVASAAVLLKEQWA